MEIELPQSPNLSTNKSLVRLYERRHHRSTHVTNLKESTFVCQDLVLSLGDCKIIFDGIVRHFERDKTITILEDGFYSQNLKKIDHDRKTLE